MTELRRAAVRCALLALASPISVPVWAQLRPDTAAPAVRISVGVAPETVTVGDRFRSFVQISTPPGARVVFPALTPSDSLQQTDSVRIVPRGGGVVAAAYPLVAWHAGVPLGAAVPVRVTLPSGEERRYLAALRLPVVRSVLPSEGEVRPRPPKGQLAAPGAPPRARWLPWLLAAALLVALVAGWLALRRIRRRPALSAREAALQALTRLRESAMPPAVPADLFYARVTRVVREYLARTDGRWGEDLTSNELLARLAGSGGPGVDRETLGTLLHHADRVKFARLATSGAEAERFWARMRDWVTANPAAVEQRKEAA